MYSLISGHWTANVLLCNTVQVNSQNAVSLNTVFVNTKQFGIQHPFLFIRSAVVAENGAIA